MTRNSTFFIFIHSLPNFRIVNTIISIKEQLSIYPLNNEYPKMYNLTDLISINCVEVKQDQSNNTLQQLSKSMIYVQRKGYITIYLA